MSDEIKRPPPESLAPHCFKPGQSGNPAGRTPVPEEIRELKRLNRAAFELLVDELMWMSREAISHMVNKEKNPEYGKVPVVKVALAKMILDGKGLPYILDQQIGKATVKIEASGPNNTPLIGSARTPEERAQRIRETQLALEKIKKAEELAKQFGSDPVAPTSGTTGE